MSNLWILNGELVAQRNFAAPGETEDGIPLVKIEHLDGRQEWVKRAEVTEVEFSDLHEWHFFFNHGYHNRI